MVHWARRSLFTRFEPAISERLASQRLWGPQAMCAGGGCGCGQRPTVRSALRRAFRPIRRRPGIGPHSIGTFDRPNRLEAAEASRPCVKLECASAKQPLLILPGLQARALLRAPRVTRRGEGSSSRQAMRLPSTRFSGTGTSPGRFKICLSIGCPAIAIHRPRGRLSTSD